MLALSSCFAFVFLLILNFSSKRDHPYLGLLTFVVTPGFFLTGMVLLGAGKWISRIQSRRPEVQHAMSIDLAQPKDRRALAAFVSASVIFLMATAVGSYQTYHYTESVHFCGEACHEPMKPEYVAHQNSPHARVACSECHVGSGAANYVKAKWNGVHQLYCTLTGSFQRPIQTPVRGIPTTQETCEQCHWPDRDVGWKEVVRHHFLADETNTPFSVRLSLHVGGGNPVSGSPGGIHWHMNLANRVEYIATDERRQVIPWVRFTDAQGKVTEYRTPKFTNDISKFEIRRMDCMDCHSRPAHDFRSPNDAVDQSLASGRLPLTVPWIKSNLVHWLTREYKTEGEALASIEANVRARYAGEAKVESIVAEASSLFRRNMFPEMKTDWRVHANNASHKDWPGCFRCHDGSHKATDGKTTIKASDCNSCHLITAQGNRSEFEKIEPKGLPFVHLDAEYSDFSCHDCHTGAFPK